MLDECQEVYGPTGRAPPSGAHADRL